MRGDVFHWLALSDQRPVHSPFDPHGLRICISFDPCRSTARMMEYAWFSINPSFRSFSALGKKKKKTTKIPMTKASKQIGHACKRTCKRPIAFCQRNDSTKRNTKNIFPRSTAFVVVCVMYAYWVGVANENLFVPLFSAAGVRIGVQQDHHCHQKQTMKNRKAHSGHRDIEGKRTNKQTNKRKMLHTLVLCHHLSSRYLDTNTTYKARHFVI